MDLITIYIWCLAGIVARTLVPYLLRLINEPETKFDRKFLVPPIATVLLSLFVAPFALGQLPPGSDWIAAFTFGWSANDLIREVVKTAVATVNAEATSKSK